MVDPTVVQVAVVRQVERATTEEAAMVAAVTAEAQAGAQVEEAAEVQRVAEAQVVVVLHHVRALLEHRGARHVR